MDLTQSIEARSDQVSHERWLPVVGYEGAYEASDRGRVRSLNRVDRAGNRRAGRTLKPFVTAKGYLKVDLSSGGVVRTFRVHRLILTAFVGRAPEDMEGRHLDGNPANNALLNLKWGTPSENNRDRVAHGTHSESAKTHCPSGHPYDGQNLYVTPEGSRKCHQCRRDRYATNRHRAQKRSAA